MRTSDVIDDASGPDSGYAAVAVVNRRDLLLGFAGLVVAMLLASLDQTVFSTALPSIVGDLEGVDLQQWVTTTYLLAATVTMPVYGRLGDLLGHRSLFVAALALFLAGSVIGASASDMTGLITGRAIQGLGGGGLMILAQAIIADIVPARQRARYMGVLGGVFGLSAVLGPLLGGWFTDGVGWRWAFWLNVPLGILAIVAALAFLKPPRRLNRRPRIDIAGISTLTVAVAAVVLISSWGGTTYAWSSPTILTLIALAAASAALFVWVEHRSAEPVMPLRLFRSRNFNLATLGGLCIAVAMFGAIGYMPTYLQMVTSLSATTAGLLLLPMVAGLMATATVTGNVASSTGRYKWMPLASAGVTAVGLLLLSTLSVDASLWTIGTYLFVLGAGIGLGMQILVLIVQNSFQVSEVGTATAANNFFREIGGSLGSAVVGTAFTHRLLEYLRTPGATTAAGGARLETTSLTPDQVNRLPQQLHDAVVAAYNDALMPVFLYLVPLLLLGLLLLLFITEEPLAVSNNPTR